MLKNRELELAQQVMKDLPGSGDAYILTGDLHRRLGSSTKAVEFWQKGLQLHPNRADVYRNLGIVAMEKGDFEEAVSFWQKALEINPQMPGVHAAIARALMGLGRQDEAIKELEDDVRISPQSADSYFLLGQAFLQKQDYARAKMCYERAIELRPDHPNSYYGLSTACARLKEPDKAREYRAIFKKLRTARPEDREYGHAPSDDLARVRGNLADLSMRAAGLYQARGNTRRTEELLKQAVAADPNSTAPHKRLAALYRMTNRIPAALAQCERVRQLEPNDPTCHLLIATLALQLKRADRAEAAFRNFIALCPDQSVGYRELAHLYIRTNTRLSEAEKLAKKAVELEPTADNYFALGQACQKVGDKQGALAAMRKAVELAPDNREYKKVYDLIRYGR
ncbi:MAG: tetratricopeptide repeat protein [Phycisphaerales bacterium]|nr:MAG: tetratricopeptide repeat protein [Phycisphaerales bacterium]